MKKYKERKSIDIDWNEVLSFVVAIFIVGMLIAVCVNVVYAVKKEAEKDRIMYNNGIHQDCGGVWVIKGIDAGDILFECNKCGGSFKTAYNFSSLEG